MNGCIRQKSHPDGSNNLVVRARTIESNSGKRARYYFLNRFLEAGIMNILKTRCFILFFLGLTSFFSLDARAATWHVPDDHPTIQGAIDAASVVNGDTVLVREGIYNETISFNGKAITLRSEKGAATTIIDGGQADTVVCFSDDEGTGSVLEGFTIQNGYASSGGGIRFYGDCYPVIVGCTITGNRATNSGGGIHCYTNAYPTFYDCQIKGNRADDGGGIFCQTYAAPEFTNCMITGNRADGEGGGLNCYYYCFPVFVNCTFSGNSAGSANYGGGVCAKNSSAVNISNSVLWGNEAGGVPNEIYYSGGGVYVTYSDVEGGWTGTGNIDIDPEHVDPRPASEAPTAAGDYHLTIGSPCDDTGTLTNAPEYDFEGDPRLATAGGDNMPDMGADEFRLAPVPDIKANGSNGPVYITTSDTLSVTVGLSAGGYSGHDADWWVVNDTPFGWYYYNVVQDLWKPGFSATFQGALYTFRDFDVFNQTLPQGTYTIYFGVDVEMNGVLDIDQTYYDSVEVTVSP